MFSKLLLSYRTISHTGRLESPPALTGKQIRAPLTMWYSTNEKVWYKKNQESNPERAEFIMQKGYTTAIINREKGNSIYVAEPISMSTPQMNYVNENSQSNMKEQR